MTTNSLKRINKNENIDEIRQRNIAYEYLCHLEEAKIWIESCIKETLPPSTELEHNLRNGVVLAKLGHYLNSDLVPLSKIYDADFAVFNRSGLRFRHTDNINYFIKAVIATQLPKTFLPETVDIYEAKNLPRLIYCVHALSRHLFRSGHAPLIQDLFGKVRFSDSDIDTMRDRLDSVRFVLPCFGKLNSLLSTTEASGGDPLQALRAINQAIRDKDVPSLRSLLKPPAYHTIDSLYHNYTDTLYTALQEKVEQLQNHSLNESFEPDEYSELLTQAQIQGYLSQINIEHVWNLLVTQRGGRVSVWETLHQQHVNIQNLVQEHEAYYQEELSRFASTSQSAQSLAPNEKLSLLQRLIYKSNERALAEKQRVEVLRQIDTLLGKLVELRRRNSSTLRAVSENTPTQSPTNESPNNAVQSSPKTEGPGASFSAASYIKPWCSSTGLATKKWSSVSATGLNTKSSSSRIASTQKSNSSTGSNVTFKTCLNELFELLSHDVMELRSLDKFSLPLYMEDLMEEKQHAGSISYPRLKAIIELANTVSNISKSLDTALPALFWDALNAPRLGLGPELDPTLKREYANALKSCRQFKAQNFSSVSSVLNLSNIRKCVQMVNAEHNLQSKTLDTILDINKILQEVHIRRQQNPGRNSESKYQKPLMELLNETCLNLTELSDLEDHELLVNLLAEKFAERVLNLEPSAAEDDESETCLWLEEVQGCVQQALLVVQHIRLFMDSQGIGEVRQKRIMSPVRNTEESKENINVMNITDMKRQRGVTERDGDWEQFNVINRNVYINMKTGQYRWTPPPSQTKAASTTKPRRSLDSSHIYRNMNEVLFVKLQAQCRGFLARKRFLAEYIRREQHHAAVKIQTWWRHMLREKEKKRRQVDSERRRVASVAVTRRVSSVRTAPVKRKRDEESFSDRMQYYMRNVNSVVKIQAAWRGKMVRNMYMLLFSSGNDKDAQKQPTFKMLKRFVEHLDTNIKDYHTAIELQRMRTDISQLIIKNKTLNKVLEDLDLKIFLLVQNRLSLNDILKCKNDIAMAAAEVDSTIETQAKNEVYDKYAYLLYILQVKAEYLVRLHLCVPHATQPFLHNITLSLFNSGHTSRDEYLMLRALSLMLREEILNSDKYARPLDIITSPPVAMKIILYSARERCGVNSLKTILKSLIEKLMKENGVIAYTNPISIYNQWRGELEFTTGKVSDLPAVVEDVNQALSYEHVKRTLTSGIQKLESTTNVFLKRIVSSKEYIPFGLLYMISELKEIMQIKFGGNKKDEKQTSPSLYPDLQALQNGSNDKPCQESQQHSLDKDIIKVIGHFLYYSFLNSAIVAPEAFKIISLRPGQEISAEQRHNLALVAKLLQFAAAKKGYGEDSAYLMCLNKFITYCHDKLRVFFEQCCQVPSLEDYYGINEYSEELLAAPPTICTNIGDMFEFHSILLTYKYDVCTDSEDVLLKLLHELNAPNLIYKAAGIEICPQKNKMPISFVLTVPNKDEPQKTLTQEEIIAKLFIQTKELLVVVLPCLGGHTLPGALRMESTREQEDLFRARVRHLAQYNPSLASYTQMSLKSTKVKLRKYFSTLEEAGYVSRENGYQEIISKLIQDINNKKKYQQMQSKELRTVRETHEALLEKIDASTELIESYEKYILSCLKNMTLGKQNVHRAFISTDKHDKKLQNKLTITYTGKQLFDKGILIKAEGLNEKQLKNILIEFKPKETYGSFQVNGKFMGVQMESAEINIQDLLQKKFHGITIMEIFGKTKVNVNLLLHLLNKKYYSKH